MPNIVADSCVHKEVCFQSGGMGCVSKCRHWLAVEKFTSTNSAMPKCPKCQSVNLWQRLMYHDFTCGDCKHEFSVASA